MMTKTTLSDGRRTRPRFAAPTPTPPKFLIGTIEQSENHSTPSKQTTNPNPNRHKTRFSRPPRRLADSPWRNAAPGISRPPSGLAPNALTHPRKPLGLSRSLDFTPFAQPHPRKPLTPLPAVFSYRWPPAGVLEVLSTSRPLSGLAPIVYPEGRRASPASRRAQPHPRKKTSGRGFIPSIIDRQTIFPQLALIHPRKPLVSGVLQGNGGASYASLPFALVHPRNKRRARSRSAGKSKTPAGCRRYKNPFLIVTPRLEIATTARKTNKMQNSNRYKTAVLPPPPIDAIRRSTDAASPPPLKILIANLELEFRLTHTKVSH
jgi:hypothetical protein